MLLTPSGAAPRLLLLLHCFCCCKIRKTKLPKLTPYTNVLPEEKKYLQNAMHLRAPCVAAEQQRHYVSV
jgi:hypothetical protein